MNNVTMCQLIDLQSQCKHDAVEWAKVGNQITDEQRLSDFSNGHLRGWNDAIRTLQIQGLNIQTARKEDA